MPEQIVRFGNRFEIANPAANILGRGGFGDVYRGADTLTGNPVAVKILKKSVLDENPDGVRRFVQEGEALGRLNHPNIVKLVAAVQESAAYYLVLEYLTGGSLRDYLAVNGALPFDRVVEASLDMCDALTRAHRLGILHRDLKPDNVLLDTDGTFKLADFGLAQVVDSTAATMGGAILGTPAYIAPEHFQGAGHTEKTDIWALGVMMYEMLSGNAPFRGENCLEMRKSVISSPTPDLKASCSDIPDALCFLLYQMLEKEPRRRISSARAIGTQLETIQKAIESDKTRSTPSRRATSSSGRIISSDMRAASAKHNLPAFAVAFVGRSRELQELSARVLLWGRCRTRRARSREPSPHRLAIPWTMCGSPLDPRLRRAQSRRKPTQAEHTP